MTVHADLTMNDGIVTSDITNILIVADDGTTSNASNASYVDGYMRKLGNDAFVFPSGNGGFYGPIGISAPSLVTEQFEARYFWVMPHADGFDSTMHDITIHHISKVEYWKLNRTSGASNPIVTLTWDTPRSGGVVDENDLRFVRWDGSSWRDLGLGGLTGTAANGTLINSVGITAFSDSNPYTLGTIDAINPLPIELTTFTGVQLNDVVKLHWTTLSEVNNDFFTLEKSRNGTQWESFLTIPGAGNSSSALNYSEIDENPFIGLSYYRLKQTDFDGSFDYFGPISIQTNSIISMYPNPANGIVYLVGEMDESDVKIYSVTGQQVDVQIDNEGDKLYFNTETLANGTYYVSFGNERIERLVVSH